MILGTMLHGIGAGNMIPSWVRTICIDINPAVVTKLSDRGSAQTVGIVTDVETFLHPPEPTVTISGFQIADCGMTLIVSVRFLRAIRNLQLVVSPMPASLH